MIHLLWPSSSRHEPKAPETLLIGGIKDYDFSDAADQIYNILSVLQLCDLVPSVPYREPEDVLDVIQILVESDELQISESLTKNNKFADLYMTAQTARKHNLATVMGVPHLETKVIVDTKMVM